MRLIALAAFSIGLWALSFPQAFQQPEGQVVQGGGAGNRQRRPQTNQQSTEQAIQAIREMVTQELQLEQERTQELQAAKNQTKQDSSTIFCFYLC